MRAVTICGKKGDNRDPPFAEPLPLVSLVIIHTQSTNSRIIIRVSPQEAAIYSYVVVTHPEGDTDTPFWILDKATLAILSAPPF